MDADSIKIECEENGFWLVIQEEVLENLTGITEQRFLIEDPEALYDHVRAAIEPWLMEREAAFSEFRKAVKAGAFACNPDESGGYDLSDPKHSDFHSVHADIWDAREGK